MTRRCLVMETRFDSEPAAWLDRLLPALRPLLEAIGPQTMFVCSPGGRVSRDRKYKWAAVEESVHQPTVGDLSFNTYEGPAPLTVKVYLRDNPEVDVRFQPPAAIWAAVEGAPARLDEVLHSFQVFLMFAASVPGVLHGGTTLLDNLAQAHGEVTGTSTEVAKQPTMFRSRHDHDWWRNTRELRTSCRRLYWTTLLGPALAAAAGGAAAARAAGALDVTEVAGSLIFRAMEGPPRDSLDPEFLAATPRLRRWLWPHTFKNPLDAVGVEAEVGVAPPGTTDDAAPT